MSLEGRVEDVSVADLLQFIHVGRRTGTLLIRSSGQDGAVVFHEGRIVAARSPASRLNADLLVVSGIVDPATLAEALRLQGRMPDVPLARTLISEFGVPETELHAVVEQQIGAAIAELAAWNRGTFEFLIDELNASGDLSLFAGETIVNLNTQAVLMEAMRTRDEAARSEDAVQAIPGEITNVTPLPEIIRPPAGGPQARRTGQRAVVARVRVQLVSADAELVGRVTRLLANDTELAFSHVAFREAGLPMPGEEPPLVVVDMRDRHTSPEMLANFRKARPRMILAAIHGDGFTALNAYEAGVTVALPPDAAVIAAAVRSQVQGASGGSKEYTSSGLARLRKVFAEIRSGVITTTLGINLMNLVAKSAERAVLFLVKPSMLSAIGAFGFTLDGRPLALTTRGMTINLAEEHALTRAVSEGKSHVASYDDAGLPPEFDQAIGRPSSGEIAVFPVFGGQRVFSVIYVDNGKQARALEDIDFLELAVTQVGLAFENELLRRHLSKHRRG